MILYLVLAYLALVVIFAPILWAFLRTAALADRRAEFLESNRNE